MLQGSSYKKLFDDFIPISDGNNGVVFESSKTLVIRATTNISFIEEDKERTPEKTYIVKISKQLSLMDGTERDYDISLFLNPRIPRGCITTVHYFDKQHNSSVLVKEDIKGAMDFAEYLNTNSLTIESFFKVAIRLCQVLGHVHKSRVLHLDIKVKMDLFLFLE